ncbi:MULTISPECIES: hypothetical protein [unclassified Mesorhizobium]|uniref:hypothetical protein n=1 Tax=unclassified Mesorhizobium TaxID=325217 RepID=UPI000BB00179|nr:MULTISPECIES: hypothetical protein [unclassified Mesorhizobium]PBB84650.1 hypothetical protein CK216_22295 [Mesorhizobium sp. WSM3876]
MATRQIDKDRHERTSLVARELLEAERQAREAKTARLREQRLAARPPAEAPASPAAKISGKQKTSDIT